VVVGNLPERVTITPLCVHTHCKNPMHQVIECVDATDDAAMTTGGKNQLRVGVAGLDHDHGLMLAGRLRLAGARLVAFHATTPRDRFALSALGLPGRAVARTIDEIIEADDIDVVVTAAVPDQRGDIAVRALRAGKHVVADKPGVTTLDDLARIDAAASETGRRWWVLFGERFENRAVSEACERARLGDIGQVVSVLGLGPHRMGAAGRPDWFWEPSRTGGILVDIGAHQADQFLAATGAGTGDGDVHVVSSAVGNVASTAHARMEDIGMMVLGGAGAIGTHRVDYLSPKGLRTWGDGRLMIVGTEGTFEVRTNVDVGGKRGGQHLIVTDGRGVRRIAVKSRSVDWATRLLDDVRDGTDTLVAHDHTVAVSRITLTAQAAAQPWEGPTP
jgi:predicted dehydrogenase